MAASPAKTDTIEVSQPTAAIAQWVAHFEQPSPSAITWAKHATLDWLGVTIAGAHEPLSKILLADVLSEQAGGTAHVIGHSQQVTPSQAALVNGSASHALDYDDVHMRMHGHPSVPVLPALFALAEQQNASGAELLRAFIAGYEVECLLGEMIGDSHYETGWHNTATIGTFGAAAACARLLGLDAQQTGMSLGIAATQAAGLKSMFGTMCKPLHAGKAAMNGLLAARLASGGFTSREDAIECEQGFAATQSSDYQPLPIRPDNSAPYAVEANLFKYHAACYLTHSSIEACRALREEHNFSVDEVRQVRLLVRPTHLKVCNIPSPETGLQIKFSLRHTVALALSDEDTSAMTTYNDAIARRADLVALREKVQVETKPSLQQRSAAEVIIDLNDGRSLFKAMDVGIPAGDVEGQWQRLTQKFHSLVDPVLGAEKAARCIELCRTLDQAESVSELLDQTA